MLPLKDINPTSRTPFVTLAVIVACVGIWMFWQREPSRDSAQDTVFALEYAAIPCEVREARPLTIQEIEATFGTFASDGDECGVGSSEAPAAFPDKAVWLSVITSMFLHGSLLHIGGNMLYLWIFGNNIEDHMGMFRFTLFYAAGGVVATLTHIALQPGSTVPLVGASGAIAAVMGAYMVWFPDAPVRTLVTALFLFVVTIRAKWLLGVWFVLQFLTNPNSGVAWAAHVGGFVFGVAVAAAVRASPTLQQLLWRRRYATQMVGGWDPTGGAGRVTEYRRWRR